MVEQTNEKYYGFTSDLIFEWVMEDDENSLQILRAILPELNIVKIHRPETQHEIKFPDQQRGVQFDVLIEDDKHRLYEVEMQVENNEDIGKRLRYYQSTLDAEALIKGTVGFSTLKETYVICLCAFDPFKKGKRRYVIRDHDDEDLTTEIDTGATKVVVNAKGTHGKITRDLEAIINVMNEQPDPGNRLAQRLRREIDVYNRDHERRRKLMNYEMRLQEKWENGVKVGVAKGLAKGEVKGKVEGTLSTVTKVIESMKDAGDSDKEIFNFARKVSDGKISDEKLRSIIANS